MKNCDKYNLLIEKGLYGELDQKENEELQKHLEICLSCKLEYDELRSTLEVLSRRKRDEPEEEFIENLWGKIEPELESEKNNPINWIQEIIDLFKNRRIAFQFAGGFALLLVGFFLGRYLFSLDTAVNVITDNGSNISIQTVDQKVDRYIDRSKILLLGLMNFDSSTDDIETISMPQQQRISKELVLEAKNLKSEISKSSDVQLKKLILDLEIILLQIANLEEDKDLEGIELIKDGVDQRGIFLKINIQEMRKSRSLQNGFEDEAKKQNAKNI